MMTERNIKFPRENKTQIQTDSEALHHGQSANYFKSYSCLNEDDCKSL